MVVHNVHILDASGSMDGSRMRTALEGINSEISELQKDDSATYLQTVVSFGYARDYKVLHNKQPIQEVGKVRVKAYGLTALYDAIGKTLEDVVRSRKPNEKTIVKVFTDGGENSSRSEYRNPEVLNEFIKKCEQLDITVAFIGTQPDVENIIRRLGIDRSNTLSHNNTSESIGQVFAQTMISTKEYVGKSLRGEDTLKGFYKQSGSL